jgi:queuosine precursor transporter
MDKRTQYFIVLMTLHSSLLVTSTIAGSKFFALPLGFSASATVLSYMFTSIILDSIAELYGRQYSRFVINLGLVAMALSTVYFQFAIWLPPAGFWKEQKALALYSPGERLAPQPHRNNRTPGATPWSDRESCY